ncbi:hypothetical protein BX600DRAFT_534344 [Xylariales sp. PMI_506]|nr:hypothetical protein BX600DRAFT_534344 [Xylariales sp. PMI_506]
MSKKIVTIVGATGLQGKGVIAAFADGPYHIRGITRNPNSASAQTLSAQGIEVVKADIDDLASLKAAFAGSHIIFAVTNFYEYFEKYGPEKAAEIETKQGANMAEAAAATTTLEHYIWSTLPRDSEQYPVPHFGAKHKVDNIIRENPTLLAKTTFIMVCYYSNNLGLPSYRPYWIETAKKYVQFTTHAPETQIPLIGDVSVNLTPFIRAIVARPEDTRNGTMIIASAEMVTADEWVKTWAEAKGVEVQTVRISREAYDALWPWPSWAEEFAKMFDLFEKVPIPEWLVPGQKVLTKDELGLTGFQTLKEWVQTYELPAL